MISFILAAAENGTIGAGGKIPWRIPGELAYFKRVTMGHPIVMGRKTFESIGKPLPGRPNYIVTRDKGYKVDSTGPDGTNSSGAATLPEGTSVHVVHDIAPILEVAKGEEVFVTGGSEIFDAFFPYAEKIYLTVVHQEIEGDTFFPALGDEWKLEQSTEGPATVIPHTFQVYRRV